MQASPVLVRTGHPIAFMLGYARQRLPGHAVLLVSVIAAVAFSVGAQYGVKNLVDSLSNHGDVWMAFAILAALVAADNLSWRVGGWVATHVLVAVTGDIRRDLFRHLTGHAPSYFADRLPGMLAGRITATSNAIYLVESMFFWNVLPPSLAVLLSIVLLGTVDPVMALVLIAVSACLAAVIMRIAARGDALHQDYATQAAAVDGELVDVINNMPLVRAFGATLRERERFASKIDREIQSRGRSLRYLEKLRLFHAASTAVLTAGLLAWAVMLWQQGLASAGDVVLVCTLGFTILHGSRDLAVALVDMVQHVARVSEALATLLLPHELQDREDAQALPAPRGEVAFHNVIFSYPEASAVLRDFTLGIAPGSRVGIVGRSGSGKSTVLALLQRLRVPQAGRILVDGVDIADLTQESLTAAISVVPQDVMLFHRSVMENIRYGRPDAHDEEVRAAAEAAGCREFIEALPQGWLTLVGDRGVKLSGGQRQRLAIARAFLRNAPILVLDEATSALDTESEAAVQRALDRLMQGRTVIAVAHRLSTLRDFDRIVVMQNGRIVQDGSPAELENRHGPYRELLRRQGFRVIEAAA
ncbi:ABC transporter ATP-binding protein [Rhodovastum atsumiense]|uniref:ABC transporter ATP-binding protein n=1 Tax=Rhodovastum atsumiense TaxID=504468 RepID=A0A5M6ILC4_9PROT|nr:ABC transporter ATP-binding protein [Rhodovastum atsumiense]KAA5609044.1 ABC transporter ATP-binding protein [Rhodovastum atsumiense]CAH2604686.1 ABC transporter ATP-binding protein [Rhodovastum atsumiense]